MGANVKFLKTLAFACVLAFVGSAGAGTFNLFQPSTGILKGNSNTYVTSPATSADIYGLWTGTCSASNYLRGDGTCAVPAGTGVTSVGLTVPSGLSVSGSPITSSGTLNITTLLNGIVKGNGSGFTTAASSDVVGLWSGTCDSSTFLRGDGSCAVAGGGTSPDNPTASVGLTAVNGSASTYMRSDAAPALSQSIAPTWTGTHTFSNTTAQIALNNSGAGLNQKNTLVRVNSSGAGFIVSSATDAAPTTVVDNIITANRTGSAWSSLAFGNLTDNPSYTFNGTGVTTLGGSTNVSNTQPRIGFNETDQAANSKSWQWIASGGNLFLDVCDDTFGSCPKDALALTRSGLTVSALTFGNATDNPTYTFAGTGAGSVAGFWNFTSVAGTQGEALRVSNSAPAIGFDETDAGANSRLWYVQPSSGTMFMGLCTDAIACRNYLSVARSAGSVSSMTFGNATDSPTYTFAGSGVITANGGVDMTPGVSSVSRTPVGCASGSVTVTAARQGNIASFTIPAFTCTSNGTSFSINSAFASSAFNPAHDVSCSFRGVDNGSNVAAWAIIQAASPGTIVFAVLGGTSAWTASGSKGAASGGAITCTYPVN